ncbi:MAG: NUDIX domain-containing protein [Vicinamibacteria bacterium]
MTDQIHELLNVYDAAGRVVGSMARGDAKAQGFAAGAVQLLLVNARGEVLLQRRREDKENGGFWDKSVGGHVQAGESFDDALRREANEELFGSATANKVTLVDELAEGRLERHPVIARKVRVELGLRDIRYASSEGRPLINVTYHAAMYLGRTLLPLSAFAPQQEELADLRFFTPAAIDKMLVSGELAPNMGFLWFALGGLATSRW